MGLDRTLPIGSQGYTEQLWWDCWGNWQPPQPEVIELNMPVQDPVPGPSSLIQPAQEGPRWMSRVRQPGQQPDNVHGNELVKTEALTDSAWQTQGSSLRQGQVTIGNGICSYISCKPAVYETSEIGRAHV